MNGRALRTRATGSARAGLLGDRGVQGAIGGETQRECVRRRAEIRRAAGLAMQAIAVEQRDHPLDLETVRVDDDECFWSGRDEASP